MGWMPSNRILVLFLGLILAHTTNPQPQLLTTLASEVSLYDTITPPNFVSHTGCLNANPPLDGHSKFLCLYMHLSIIYESTDFNLERMYEKTSDELTSLSEMCNNYGISIMNLHYSIPRFDAVSGVLQARRSFQRSIAIGSVYEEVTGKKTKGLKDSTNNLRFATEYFNTLMHMGHVEGGTLSQSIFEMNKMPESGDNFVYPVYSDYPSIRKGDCGEREESALLYARFDDHEHALWLLSDCPGVVRDTITSHMNLSVDWNLRPPARPEKAHTTDTPSSQNDLLGVFLLHSPLRPFVDTYHQLASVLRVFYHRYPSESRRLKLHVMVSTSHSKEGRDLELERKWREALGPAADMLEGVFVVDSVRPYRDPTQGNYLRKIFAATVISERFGYRNMMSIDNDVVISPDGILQLLMSSDMLETGECGMVTPTLSTGVPTTEMFASRYMDEDDRTELFECFQHSNIMDDSWDAGYEFGEKGEWDSSMYYEKLWGLAPELLFGENPITSLGLALHPVRWNSTCTELMSVHTLRNLRRQWRRSGGEGCSGGVCSIVPPPTIHRTSGVYPYVANSCWVASVKLVEEVLKRDDIYSRYHPFDEAGMNVLLWHEGDWRDGEVEKDGKGRVKEHLCAVETFAVHPSYVKGEAHEGITSDLHWLAKDIMEHEFKIWEAEDGGGRSGDFKDRT